jgi:hypothetical protein
MVGTVALDELIAQRLGLLAGLGVGDLGEQGTGLGLQPLGQPVEDVAELVVPAALLIDLGEDLGQGGPDAEVAVGDDQPRSLQTALAQPAQDARPRGRRWRAISSLLRSTSDLAITASPSGWPLPTGSFPAN